MKLPKIPKGLKARAAKAERKKKFAQKVKERLAYIDKLRKACK